MNPPARSPSGPVDLRAAVAFLTPFGGRRGARPTPATMAYFPVVGASLGALIGLCWHASRRRLPPLPAAALVVAIDALMTGGLHLDGLADTADGLCAHVPARSRLEIMAEPQVGTFAVVALGAALISRTAAFAALEPSPALLAALYCSSRSVMVIGSRALPYRGRRDWQPPSCRSAGSPTVPLWLVSPEPAQRCCWQRLLLGGAGQEPSWAVGSRGRSSWSSPGGGSGGSPATSWARPESSARQLAWSWLQRNEQLGAAGPSCRRHDLCGRARSRTRGRGGSTRSKGVRSTTSSPPGATSGDFARTSSSRLLCAGCLPRLMPHPPSATASHGGSSSSAVRRPVSVPP